MENSLIKGLRRCRHVCENHFSMIRHNEFSQGSPSREFNFLFNSPFISGHVYLGRFTLLCFLWIGEGAVSDRSSLQINSWRCEKAKTEVVKLRKRSTALHGEGKLFPSQDFLLVNAKFSHWWHIINFRTRLWTFFLIFFFLCFKSTWSKDCWKPWEAPPSRSPKQRKM